MYRLFLNGDHMDSLSTTEGGYTNEGLTGYGWTSSTAVSGLSAYIRARNGTTGDHTNHHAFESAPTGYTDESAAFYGFRRFNNTDTSLVTISGGGVTAHANVVAGGAIWDWTWNGKQFVNAQDCGREIQTALQVPSRYQDIPECGDRFSVHSQAAWLRHGAPLASSSAGGTTFTSASIPLDWGGGANHWGASQDGPNLWLNWRIGKTITMNFNNMGPVAQYQATVTAPVSSSDGVLEFPMVYMPSEFNRFWTYDAGTNSLTEVTSSMPNGCGTGAPGYTFTPSYGGVIISDSTGNYAMGVYAGSRSVGGAESYFAMWKFWCAADGSAQYNFDTSKLDIIYGNSASIPTGTSTYVSYLINGTVTDVASKMLALKNAGYK